ncbi:hypothetical protein A2W60_03000 [Candidatus Azambacteria bacterium RIFCSPHIGHO2_02_46_12]|uniref:Deoxynucleoside kinase domain-containing protein n=1 Tax=Candidatus Azambacteria bacterium RIFCSPHIGHO2_02_46_12 TaxID=1797295 RepID=A0A1F5BI74_9BACT|nr:MAG: hypothetical protein A2W60_03000 [Candidatus Azambacteria bacterium RIFCSPHIGHO2_02_46_12]
MGKTTLIENAIKKLNAAHIREPNHLTARISPKNTNFITRWYFKAHERNLERAYILARKGKIVLIERSPLSSVVFSQAYLNKKRDAEMRHFESYIKNLRDNHGIRTYLVYLKQRKIDTVIATMKKKSYLKAFSKIKFLQALDYQLRVAIQRLEKENLILVLRNPTQKSLIKLLK